MTGIRLQNYAASLVIRSSIAFLVCLFAFPPTAKAQDYGGRLEFFRWLEDYSNFANQNENDNLFASLKHIPISQDSYPYLTIGGDYRLRYEYFSNQFYGLRGDFSTNSVLHRFLLHADLQFENARAFVQLSNFQEQGQRGGPGILDQSSIDFHQAFFDWTPSWGQLRLGRQEVSLGGGKKTGIREGPNQRRAFDGARLTLDTITSGPLDIFYLREVQANPDAFGDSSSSGAEFFGVYANSIFEAPSNVNVDLFFLSIDREDAVFDQSVDRELRHSIGTRLHRTGERLTFDVEATYQFGNFGSDDISAWGLASEITYALSDSGQSHHVGLRFNLASGDRDPDDRRLGTYNVLFPNAAYISEAAIYAPGNGLDVQPFIDLHLKQNFSLFLATDFQWRLSRNDAVFATPGVPLITGNLSDDRFIAWLATAVVSWRPNPYITIQAVIERNFAGNVVRDAGGESGTFVMFSTALRF